MEAERAEDEADEDEDSHREWTHLHGTFTFLVGLLLFFFQM